MNINKTIGLLLTGSLALLSAVSITIFVIKLSNVNTVLVGELEAIDLGLSTNMRGDIDQLREDLINEKKNFLKIQVQTVASVLQKYFNDAHDPEKLRQVYEPELKAMVDAAIRIIDRIAKDPQFRTLADKQRKAAELIGAIRYGQDGTDYLWINDRGQPFPRMVMHPIVPALNGQVLDDPKYHCALGRKENLFKAVVDAAQAPQGGFVDYVWPRPSANGLSEEQPKLSYVRAYPEWGWIIGTGVYLSVAEDRLKADAAATVASLRYGDDGSGYFWINDTERPFPRMVMHPTDPSLNGQVLDAPKFNCALGHKENLFKAAVDVATQDGGGFVDYLWPKPGADGSNEEQAKLSYVQSFPQWGWVIGTGVYLDDITKLVEARAQALSQQLQDTSASMHQKIAGAKADANRETISTVWLVVLTSLGLMLVILVLTLSFLRRSIVSPLLASVSAAERIADGDLSGELEPSRRRDELGLLANAQAAMGEKLKEIIQDVQTAAEQVATEFQQLSASGDAISREAVGQSDAVRQMSSAMARISANIEQNAHDAQRIAESARQTSQDIDSGKQAVDRTVEAMASIAQHIEVVEDIARQTNLLALNASIEAARAGVQGKGFAVVAIEVRKLAERSQDAAAKIKEVANAGTDIAGETGRLVDGIVTQVRETATLMAKIEEASLDQAQAIHANASSVQQLEQSIEHHRGAADDLSVTSQRLAEQSEKLNAVVGFFRV